MNIISRTSPRAQAESQQAEASDPAVSAFVEASAGSGKTKLLTDRMLRLMLRGAAPGRIQCLTFTKAAAAEMALRLQHRLGTWVTLDDAALDRELRSLEVEPEETKRRDARSLFAEVLDLPGGMRIETIHAFCQGLLRRFPLEARISPHFELIEDVAAAAEMRAAQDGALEQAAPADVAAVASLLRDEGFSSVLRALQTARGRLAPLLALPGPARDRLIRQAARAPESEAAVLREGVSWDSAPLAAVLQMMVAHGSNAVRERAMSMQGWLAMTPDHRIVDWEMWLGCLMTTKGEPRAPSVFAAERLAKQCPQIHDLCRQEQDRVLAIEERRRAVRCADATIALLRLAAPALGSYAEAKDRAGLLDYSDLIGRSEELLQDPGAAWVLYKLDGGIDHLLLDEVQDTAPDQWRIAHRLTEEFFAGLGARDDGPARTFFAVGDPKQSIYSFQGADPDEFTRSHEEMAHRVAGSGQTWRSVTLDVSFRSTAPVLSLVDAVFDDPVAADGVTTQGVLRHRANREGAAGCVELWPLAPKTEPPELPDWTVPDENRGLVSAPQRLAEAVADHIAGMLRDGTVLPSKGRPLEPGDVLVLLRRRHPFARPFVAALKAKGVPVAGLDRLTLTEQLAVQDLLAACDAVLLREDDLAVACVLTSPLGGLSDDSLMALALGRQGWLWDTLRDRAHERPEWEAAWSFLSTLAQRADYVSPHALLTEALGRLGGRARLLARLGAEAAEPIDELLGAALSYTRLHPPSLQGFVQWLRRSGAEVKREAGGTGSVVRVMTAHGAKGLQAPIVVIPDTTGLPADDDKLAWCEAEQVAVPLWTPLAALRCDAVQEARVVAARLRRREHNRLLYVALTRAEDRLIVCGWERKDAPPEESWYASVQRGFARFGAAEEPFAGPWGGTVRVVRSDQVAPPEPSPPAAWADRSPLPPWAGRPGAWTPPPPPQEPALPSPLAPSRPVGALFGPVPAALSPLLGGAGQRFARGQAVHALLQHLPGMPDDARDAAMRRYLLRSGLSDSEQDAVAGQVRAVLDHPALRPLWGEAGRAEQPLSGLVGGPGHEIVVSGVVDRMAVLPESVLVADFKTGRAAPDTVAATPARYIRQLSAYRAVLRDLFPGRVIRCWLVWTEDAVVAELPDPLLDARAPGR